MAGNTFGTVFRVTTFGESHGEALGAVIDGCPPNIPISIEKIQAALNRRRPGAHTDNEGKKTLNKALSSRSEADKVQILSGTFEGRSTGCPIALLIYNTEQRSKDYASLADVFRPGHADYTYYKKYGIRDHRGGGRSSGRETAARVASGAIASMILDSSHKITITAYTKEAAGICAPELAGLLPDTAVIEANSMRAAHAKTAKLMEAKIAEYRKQGESCGGIVECIITGIPAGWGEPVFDKLDAELAKAVLSIGAVKGIEFGLGFESARRTGSAWNDAMNTRDGESVHFAANNAGGILGGISTGNTIIFRTAIKPVPSITLNQQTLSLNDGKYENIKLSVKGRHDVCLCPRIIPVIEAMSAITLADMYLRSLACPKA